MFCLLAWSPSAQCGGSMTDFSGVILSPGFPGNYQSSLDCSWRVQLPIGFGLSSSSICPFHFSSLSSFPFICSALSPFFLTSIPPRYPSPGISIRGYVCSPHKLLLSVPVGIHLQFLNFSTEPVHDYLEVRSGSLETGTVIDRFSGSLVPNSLFSTTHETTLFFHSDYSQNKPGFHLFYDGEQHRSSVKLWVAWSSPCQKQTSGSVWIRFCCLFAAYELQRCPDPRPFRNGIVVGQEYSVGMTVSFECLPGYTLLGEPSLTCLHGVSRNWNHPIPRCEGIPLSIFYKRSKCFLACSNTHHHISCH